MDRTIEIKEESDPSSYFYFHPVIIEKSSKIKEDDIKYLEEKFLIEEGDIECFLFYFLKKYFDESEDSVEEEIVYEYKLIPKIFCDV